MTTTIATSPAESLPIGSTSIREASSSAQVIVCDFNAPRPLPLANTVSVESLVAEFESESEMKEQLAQARRSLSSTMYADEPETLSALRLAAGLSQAQLAHEVGTSQPHIARIERGQTDPSTDLIARIARALEIDEARAFRAIRKQLSTRSQST